MASTKVRALIGILRLLLGIGIGAAVWYMWSTIRIDDPEYMPIGAGLITALMAALLLDKLKGGGDS